MEKGKVAEVVIYQVKAEECGNRELIIDRVNAIVENFEGFISRAVHQSPDDPSVFMDYVLWESLEQAVQAAQQAQSMPEMAPFMRAITEIRAFAHYTVK